MGLQSKNRKKNRLMLNGFAKKNGFDLWRHSFSAYSKKSGEVRQFFIEYYIVNPGISPKIVNFNKPCFLMVKAGCWGKGGKQFHKFFPIDSLYIDKKSLNIRVENFLLTENELFGSINVPLSMTKLHPEYLSSQGSMAWKIKLEKKINFEPKKLKRNPQNYWYVCGAKTIYGGNLLLDAEEFVIIPQKSFGHADKIWGKDFSNPFFSLSSCNLNSVISGRYLSGSCFDIGGTTVNGKEKSLQVYLLHQNQYYVFSISNCFSRTKIHYDFFENSEICRWTVTAENSKNFLDVDVFCKKSEMIKKKYLNPRGTVSFDSFWSGGNGTGEIRLYKKVNKDLEIVEQARIENCICEYAADF
ncbi:MAG: hypothetical protein ACTTHG_05830 [Treponemataceae bacterium]